MNKKFLFLSIFFISSFANAENLGRNLLLDYYNNQGKSSAPSVKENEASPVKTGTIKPINAPKNKYTETMNKTSDTFFNALKKGRKGIQEAVDTTFAKDDPSFQNPGYGKTVPVSEALSSFLRGDDELLDYQLVDEQSYTKGAKIIRTYFANTRDGNQRYFKMYFLDAGIGDILLIRVNVEKQFTK